MRIPIHTNRIEEAVLWTCLWATVLMVVLALCGCSVIRVRDSEHKIYTTLYVPAYPWSDVTKTLSRLSVTYRTNGLTITLKDYGEETVGATNLAGIVEGITAGVVRGLK